MKRIFIKTHTRKLLADTLTPVGIYLRLRDMFSEPLLLESSDYHARDNSFSFICLETIGRFWVAGEKIHLETPGEESQVEVEKGTDVPGALQAFMDHFEVEASGIGRQFNGFFGHTNYDAVRYFEKVNYGKGKAESETPDLRYAFYRYIIAINHFNEELFLIENLMPGEESRLDYLETLVKSRNYGGFGFELKGEETANLSGERFLEMVRTGKEHCQLGEVFQVVMARRFSQAFQGDEFNVYRALRSINPSPYLFYFDYGNYKLFGSSPEAQLVSDGARARIHPIAGTFRRTGDDALDAQAALELTQDPKENAEHVMLVDLARNDLGRNATQVEVTSFREVQYFSHVIHLVSTVEGDLPDGTNPVRLLADTFPAGTLSGAPKIRALDLISEEEPGRRGFYGGAIGKFGLDGEVNHAIVIRSFMSRNNQLEFQAGAGIVVDSVPENELQEVDNKLAALRKALQIATTI